MAAMKTYFSTVLENVGLIPIKNIMGSMVIPANMNRQTMRRSALAYWPAIFAFGQDIPQMSMATTMDAYSRKLDGFN